MWHLFDLNVKNRVNAFQIGLGVYVLTLLSLGVCGTVIAMRRAGPLLTSLVNKRNEIESALKKGAVSRWDPFHPDGAKWWRRILVVEFVGLMVLNFVTL